MARFDQSTGKLLQSSGVTIGDDNAVDITGSIAGHMLRVRNDTVSGELIEGVNGNGNVVFQVNKNGSEDAILRVNLDNGTNGLVSDSGYTKIGPNGNYGVDYSTALRINGMPGETGVEILAGENPGDVALRISDQDNTFGGGEGILTILANNGEIGHGTSTPIYGFDNQLGAGNTADFNTANGVYRIAGNPLAVVDIVDGQDWITTNSSSHVVASGMTLTPSAGTYAVTWTAGGVSSQNSSGEAWIQIYVGGVPEGSEMYFRRAQGTSSDNAGGLMCVAKVSADGTEAIEGRWRAAGGTAEMEGRSLMIVSVTP